MWQGEVQRRDMSWPIRRIIKSVDKSLAAVLKHCDHVCLQREKRKVPNAFRSFVTLDELYDRKKGVVRKMKERGTK